MTNKKKKGFSLVEVAIALAIVVIVSVTALTIALYSITPKVNNNNRSHAQNFAHNAWQCFQVTNNATEFQNALAAAYDPLKIQLVDPDDGDGYATYTYTSSKHKYIATIEIFFPTNSSDRPAMNLVVTSEKGEEIIAFEYERGLSPNAE